MIKRRKFTGLVDGMGHPISRYAGEKKGFRPGRHTALERVQSGPHTDPKCDHNSSVPEFDEVASFGLEEKEIRRRWPRFFGICPDCQERVILYANEKHFIRGDW